MIMVIRESLLNLPEHESCDNPGLSLIHIFPYPQSQLYYSFRIEKNEKAKALSGSNYIRYLHRQEMREKDQ